MSNQKSFVKKILILVTILAVPGFLYYLLHTKGKNRYKPLPVYGPKEVADTFKEKRGVKIPDTIFHQVNFTGVNQNGEPYKFDEIKDQIFVVNLFYTRDTRIVPQIYRNLYILNEKYKDNKRIRFVSVSIDPEYDKDEILSKFAHQQKAKAGKWDFLNLGNNSSAVSFANNQLFLNAVETQDGLIFDKKLVLLDATGRIRGYYDATSYQEIKKMSEEITVLIAEELRKIKIEH